MKRQKCVFASVSALHFVLFEWKCYYFFLFVAFSLASLTWSHHSSILSHLRFIWMRDSYDRLDATGSERERKSRRERLRWTKNTWFSNRPPFSISCRSHSERSMLTVGSACDISASSQTESNSDFWKILLIWLRRTDRIPFDFSKLICSEHRPRLGIYCFGARNVEMAKKREKQKCVSGYVPFFPIPAITDFRIRPNTRNTIICGRRRHGQRCADDKQRWRTHTHTQPRENQNKKRKRNMRARDQ